MVDTIFGLECYRPVTGITYWFIYTGKVVGHGDRGTIYFNVNLPIICIICTRAYEPNLIKTIHTIPRGN